jgi:hypothetical protein
VRAAAAGDRARLLGAGGEAEVFEVPGRPHLAFKRYRNPTPERAAKLRVMVDNPPQVEGAQAALAWPTELVQGPGGDLAGFLMRRIDLSTSVPVFRLYNPQARQQVAPGFTWRYLLRTARNVAAIVDAVHRAGHVVGDLNESNLLVSNRALVSLVDCDSMQVTDPLAGEVHPCTVGKPEFTAPELYRRRKGLGPRTPASDSFALGVVVFLLLMEGAHPFAGIWRGVGEPPDIAARIRRGMFPYRRRSRVQPPPLAVPLATLPPSLRRLARRALAGPARRRPSPAEWVDAIAEVEAVLVQCPRSPFHEHAPHLRDCPWCARIDRGLPDPFPGPSGRSALTPRPPTRWAVLRARLGRQAARARRRLRAAPGAAWAAWRRRRTERASSDGRELEGRDGAARPVLARIRAAACIEAPLLGLWSVAVSVAPAVAVPVALVALPSGHAAFQARGRGRLGGAASLASRLPANTRAAVRRLAEIAAAGMPVAVVGLVLALRWGVGPAQDGASWPTRAAVLVAWGWPLAAASVIALAFLLPGRAHPEWPAAVAVGRARLATHASWRVGVGAWVLLGLAVALS